MKVQSIVIGEYINVGKKYWSKAGNKVHILERKQAQGKPEYEYKGRIIETVSGHEILLGKYHWFNEKGHWLKNTKGIHNLARECIE